MAITIKLTDACFAPGGIFHGVPTNRAVLFVGSNRDGCYAGKLNTGTAANLSYRGGQTVLLIDWVGTDISAYTLEYYMKNQDGKTSFGAPLLDYVERGYVEVFEDGAAITAADLFNYTA